MPATTNTTDRKPTATKPTAKVKAGVVYVDASRVKYARATRDGERGLAIVHFWDGSKLTLEDGDTLTSNLPNFFCHALNLKGVE